MSNAFAEALRQDMPETYGGLSDTEVLKKAHDIMGMRSGFSIRRMRAATGEQVATTGETTRRMIQGFGNQAAFGFGSELAQAAAPYAQDVLGALDYAGTALTGGDLKKAADRWRAALAGKFDVDIVSERELALGREDMPGTMRAAEVAGGVTGAALPLGLPGAIAGRVAGTGARLAGSTRAPAIGRLMKARVNNALAPTTLPKQMRLAAAEGALSGAGNNPDDRLGGAVTGGLLGAALPLAARGVVQGGRLAGNLSPLRAAAGAAGQGAEGVRQGFMRGYSPAGAAWLGLRRAGARMLEPYTKAAQPGGLAAAAGRAPTGPATTAGAPAVATAMARPPRKLPPGVDAEAALDAVSEPPPVPSLVPPTVPPTRIRRPAGTVDLPEPLPSGEVLPIPEAVADDAPLFVRTSKPKPKSKGRRRRRKKKGKK